MKMVVSAIQTLSRLNRSRFPYIGRMIILWLSLGSMAASAERIKDIASIQGVRSNPLVGYGLVVGLAGTGDRMNQAPFSQQTLNAMLQQFGIAVPQGMRLQVNNVAAVAVHAELGPFVKNGQTLDVTVSSLGNAKSLRGGSLLMTPLKGINGEVYAIAQGNLVVSGLGAEGRDGSRVTVNIPSVGRIPSGAIVEREVPTSFAGGKPLLFNLHRSDFTTAKRVADAINEYLGPDTAAPQDATTIQVQAPQKPEHTVTFISMIENLEVKTAIAAAKVVINSRTGTIIIGSQVRISPVAVTHGSMTVSVKENVGVSQPAPLGEGQTAIVSNSDIQVTQSNKPMFELSANASLENLVRAVNEVGAAPGDLVAILEAIKQAGALNAQLVVL